MKSELKANDIKTISDIDIYRYEHPINGQIVSRYQTLVKLYGQNNADKIMRELEVRSWP